MSVLRSRNNFSVGDHDFKIAHHFLLKGMSPTLVQVQQVHEIDIMLICHMYSPIGVTTPLDLTPTQSLTTIDLGDPSKAAAILRLALAYLIATLASLNFIVQIIVSDSKEVITMLRPQLNRMGIEVDIARGHVARIK